MAKRRGLSSDIDMTRPLRNSEMEGLHELEGDIAPPKTIVSVPLSNIQPNPDQPRKSFDPEKISELAESIKDRGLLQPLIVKKNEDAYLLVAGERRYRAAERAGLKEAPCILTTDDPFEISLIENVQREDLKPLEEAEAYKFLIDRYKYTQDQLAKIVRKKDYDISRSLSLNRLPERIRKDLVTSQVSAPKEILYIISQKSSGEEMIALWNEYKRYGLTVRELRKQAKPSSGQRWYEFKFAPEGKEFSLKIRFRKSQVEIPEIRSALQNALTRLEELDNQPEE